MIKNDGYFYSLILAIICHKIEYFKNKKSVNYLL